MSFSLEPATGPPPSLEDRLISALRIVSDGAELEGQKLALNLKLGRVPIWSLRSLVSFRLCVRRFIRREAQSQTYAKKMTTGCPKSNQPPVADVEACE